VTAAGIGGSAVATTSTSTLTVVSSSIRCDYGICGIRGEIVESQNTQWTADVNLQQSLFV
jgi:hypothetical protein